MLQELKERELKNRPVRVGLIGAGAMGAAIAWQVNRTPGMQLVFVADIDISTARGAAVSTGLNVCEETVVPQSAWLHKNGEVIVTGDPLGLIKQSGGGQLDVIVEASNTIGPAARYCLQAIESGLHVVLMNAEVDLALGFLLHHRAKSAGVVVTSDAGDQHGVLRRMIADIELWGFDIVQAGNIKGYLDRYATSHSLTEEAAKRNLSPVQCCAYTDGSKLSIEMACLANSVGLLPQVPGMVGPRAKHVSDALALFDFESYGDVGRIDYLLGAEPDGGVYVVARCDEPLQARYMSYYKMGDGPYYLFYRPYHLCHVETPNAIAEAVLMQRAVMHPGCRRLTDVYAHAKRDLESGSTVRHAIGGDDFYGLVESCKEADEKGMVPLALLEAEDQFFPVIQETMTRDEPLRFGKVDIPESFLTRKFKEQSKLLLNGGHER